MPPDPASPGAADGVAGVLLAGGRATRMGGGDKSLHSLAGRPILAHVIERVRPQVSVLLLNANGDPARFQGFGLPVEGDVIEDFAGPLAGILTGLEWAGAHAPGCRWVASFPTDAPFLPEDLVRRMVAAVGAEDAHIGCAASGGRTHPVVALWPVGLAGDLRRAMTEDGVRKIDRWTARYRVAYVEYAAEPVDPFFNVNRPGDLERAERLLGAETPAAGGQGADGRRLDSRGAA
ncbi:MAG: molybdenum cofactor guanylyltransferase MobA [Rhodospirillales bacterium]|nr:molybdenum cofactor guanylyltransferase MobA [Pseudomonadota bacterium]